MFQYLYFIMNILFWSVLICLSSQHEWSQLSSRTFPESELEKKEAQT